MDIFLHIAIIYVDITINPEKNTTAAVGVNVTLTCNASGADNLKYQWIRMGKKIIPSRARGVNSSTLIIPNIMVKDNGDYKCVVTSGNTSVTSRPGIVFVLGKLSTVSAMYFYTSTMHYTRIILLIILIPNQLYVDVKSSMT